MKQYLLKAALLLALVCNANIASAQLSDLLGRLTSKASSTGGSTGNVLSTIGSIISSKLTPTSKQIVGTWVYQKPAVMFTSGNAVKSATASVVSRQIESKLQAHLTKIGVNNGNMCMVFEEDKTFYVQRKGKKVASGTYVLDKNDITLTFKGKNKPCKVTPQLDNGTLVIVMDMTKLKDFFEGVGSKIPQLSTITSLMKTMDGMEVGIRMTKK
ncbi:MAG: DUF4923 family protein [Prevotellaceae bacterium]|nr:DUF4923 family protein [Prevotellaceae bacterium]